ncbi:MAG: HigA family addiction module antidote protein [Maricaulaceae bacterium]|nr:HigA family addiction module antidote protein [Maricaulaceae bacterium]
MTRIAADEEKIGLAIHPGAYLREEFIRPLGLSNRAAAAALGISAANLSRFTAGKQAVSTELAVRLGKAFGTSAHFWLNLQQLYDLAMLKSGRWTEIEAEVKVVAA